MENNEMNQTQENMIKGIQATVKIARWVYEAAVNEGFSQKHAFDMSIAYVNCILTAGKGAVK